MVAASDVVSHDSEIIEGNMGKVRVACAIPDGPYTFRCGLQALVDPHKSALGRFYSGQFQANAASIRRAPASDEEMGSFQHQLNAIAHTMEFDPFARLAFDSIDLRVRGDRNPLIPEYFFQGLGDVLILAMGEMAVTLDDGDLAAESTYGLR